MDDRPTLEHLLDLGVDGIITDRPDVLREVLAERGYDLPAGYTWAGDTELVDLVAQVRCLDGRAYVAVRAVNHEPAPVDVRLGTAYGTADRTGVRPDAAAYALLNARAASVPAGVVTVSASPGGGVGRDEARTVPYAGISC